MELDSEDSFNPQIQLLLSIISDRDLFIKMESTDTLIHSLKPDMKKSTDAFQFQKYLKSYLNNNEFMRRLRYISDIGNNIETSLEYYGKDYLSHDDFTFDKSFFKEMLEIREQLREFLGKLLQEISRGEEIEL